MSDGRGRYNIGRTVDVKGWGVKGGRDVGSTGSRVQDVVEAKFKGPRVPGARLRRRVVTSSWEVATEASNSQEWDLLPL